jgi:hypothetical protein
MSLLVSLGLSVYFCGPLCVSGSICASARPQSSVVVPQCLAGFVPCVSLSPVSIMSPVSVSLCVSVCVGGCVLSSSIVLV